MNKQDIQPDPELTADQVKLISSLSEVEIKNIDWVIFTHTSNAWRKMARVVGSSMQEYKIKNQGVPDLYFSQRIRKMVSDGALESQGFLENMRYSEVRRVQ